MRTARRLVQLAFLALTLGGVFAIRGNAERWCPLGGLETLYQYGIDGTLICSLGVSNLYVLAAVLLLTLLLRRAFCGYVCPLGTLSEWLQRPARWLGLRPFSVPYRLDRTLALSKYAVLGLVLLFTWRTGELVFRGYDPCYALIGWHGDDITAWAYVVAGAIVVASFLVVLPFCRWFCPLAAVLTPFSRFGLTRIKRTDGQCTNCGACTRVCPMGIPIDRVQQVTAARCTACLECVDVCPARASGALQWGPPSRMGGRWPRAVLVGTILACLGGAVAAAWALPLPAFAQSWGSPPARTAALDLRVRNLTCRGRATLLVYFLQRDDEYQVPGYVRLEAWPGSELSAVRIVYDPAQTDATALKQAIVTAYYDRTARIWRASPFEIAGYDPWGVGE